MSTNLLIQKRMKNFKTFLLSLAFVGLSVSGAVAQNVCEIGSTGYATIDAAIAAVPAGGTSQTVIKLLDNITHESSSSIYHISDKKITFDLNGFDLIFTGVYLCVESGSVVNYTGSGEFKKIFNWTGTESGYGTYALDVRTGSSIELTGVEITDNGTGTNRSVRAIFTESAGSGSVIVVNGDVKATGNGETNSGGIGIYAQLSTVTVKGNVISDKIGVLTGDNATVTVDGYISAPTYIMIDAYGTTLGMLDFDTPTTKPGYLTYTKGTNTVWVKFPNVTGIIGVPTTAFVGTPLPLTGTVVPSNAYAKDIEWTVASEGTTGATIIGNSLFATMPGVAVVMATIKNGTFIGEDYTQGFYIEVENETGVAEIIAEKISVYPNPTGGTLKIESSDLQVEKVEIYDITGKIVLTSNETTINISHFSAGTYFVKIKTDNGELIKTVMKE